MIEIRLCSSSSGCYCYAVVLTLFCVYVCTFHDSGSVIGLCREAAC